LALLLVERVSAYALMLSYVGACVTTWFRCVISDARNVDLRMASAKLGEFDAPPAPSTPNAGFGFVMLTAVARSACGHERAAPRSVRARRAHAHTRTLARGAGSRAGGRTACRLVVVWGW
jgi:hypothetical protein